MNFNDSTARSIPSMSTEQQQTSNVWQYMSSSCLDSKNIAADKSLMSMESTSVVFLKYRRLFSRVLIGADL